MFAIFLAGVATAATPTPYDPVSESTPLLLDTPADVGGGAYWTVTVPSKGLLSVVAEGADVQGASISSLHAISSTRAGEVDAAKVVYAWVTAGTWRVDVDGTSGSVTAHFSPVGPLPEDSLMQADLPLASAVTARFGDAVELKPDRNGETRGWIRLAPSKSGVIEVRSSCDGGDPYTNMLVASDAELRANHGALASWGGAIEVGDGGSLLACNRVARFSATKGEVVWVYVQNEIPREAVALGAFSTRVLARLYR